MSSSTSSFQFPLKYIAGTLGLFAVFGFLAMVLSGFAGRESIEDRAYKGVFSAEVTDARIANREEVLSAQAELVDEEKVNKALAAIAKAPAAESKSAVVVPGSPTFMKQMEEQAKADEKPMADEKPEAPAEKAEEKPKAEKKPAAEAPKKDAAAEEKK